MSTLMFPSKSVLGNPAVHRFGLGIMESLFKLDMDALIHTFQLQIVFKNISSIGVLSGFSSIFSSVYGVLSLNYIYIFFCKLMKPGMKHIDICLRDARQIRR